MTYPTIVTVSQVQRHLHLPVSEGSPVPPEDFDLQQKIDAATQLVCDYIADRQPADPDWIAVIESWNVPGSPTVEAPPVVVLAVLEQTADFYRFRGDDAGDDRGHERGFLSLPVANLLHRYRSPSVA